MLSGRHEPPKPRWIVVRSGKDRSRFVQSRMVELPIKRTAPLAGGSLRSRASNAWISFSNAAKSCRTKKALQKINKRQKKDRRGRAVTPIRVIAFTSGNVRASFLPGDTAIIQT